jgi:chemotaxis protein methyltransferase CheR
LNSARGQATSAFTPKDMSSRLYEKFSQFIYAECGIKLPPVKRIMLQSRLMKRLRALRISSFDEYYDYLTSFQGQKEELSHALDVVSTNKTGFFREPSHFDYLQTAVLPWLIHELEGKSRRRICIWSAGCSSGEEPYTLGMVLSDFLEKFPEFDFSILGTDISRRMLYHAQKAIYKDQDIYPIAHRLRAAYLLKGKGPQKGNWRITSELRNKVQFKRLNLVDEHFDLPNLMDIIFCRNVIIYFDRPTQSRLFEKFHMWLVPGGFLFIGHSETLYGINNQFEYLQATIYRKPP